MAIVRKAIKSGFTTVHNAFITDMKVDYRAKGVLLVMLSKQDGWNFSVKGLAKLTDNDGEYAVNTALKTLKDTGYLRVDRVVDARGRVVDWEYFISDEPVFLGEDDAPDDNGNITKGEKKTKVQRYGRKKKSVEEKKPEPKKPDLENPDLENPELEKPDVGSPDLENHPLNKILYNKRLSDKISINQSDQQSYANSESTEKKMNDGSIDGYITPRSYDVKVSDNITLACDSYGEQLRSYEEVIKDNIEYDELVNNTQFLREYSKDLLDEIVDIMLECVTATTETIRVHKHDMQTETVKNRMLKLTRDHIEYVLRCISEHAKEIKNVKTYIITALYNASFTLNIGEYAETSLDMRNYFSGR